jgi:hypothetical protein
VGNSNSTQLSGKQALVWIFWLLILGGIGYGGYLLFKTVHHRQGVDRAVPVVLAAMRGQRQALADAIAAYRLHLGFYPPAGKGGSASGLVNPLFYELSGTRRDETRQRVFDPTQKEPIQVAEMEKIFGMERFSNSLPFPNWPTNFLADKQLSKKSLFPGGETFGVGLNESGAVPDDAVDDFKISPWRYTTAPAVHNPGQFDLWIELDVRGRHYVVGNWPAVE